MTLRLYLLQIEAAVTAAGEVVNELWNNVSNQKTLRHYYNKGWSHLALEVLGPFIQWGCVLHEHHVSVDASFVHIDLFIMKLYSLSPICMAGTLYCWNVQSFLLDFDWLGDGQIP